MEVRFTFDNTLLEPEIESAEIQIPFSHIL